MPRNNRFFALGLYRLGAFGVSAILSVGLVAQDGKKQADPPVEQPSVTEKSEPEAAASKTDNRARPDFNSGKLRFEYKNTDWAKVIRGFAEEARLDLNMPVIPEGSFTYSSNGEFTLLEAMDLINSFLMREQNFVLIRHANMIFVHDLNVEIPSTMIETIPRSELPNRGRFEMTQTEFDISGIDGDSFYDQIQPLVRDQGGKSMLLPLSNVLFVRETGEQLRLIERFLEMAKTGKEEVLKILPLKFAMPEEILTIAAELMPLDDENVFVDEENGERLKVIVLAFESQFILSGTANAVAKFEKIVTLRDIEVAATADATSELAQPKIFRYTVANDLELNLQVVRAALAGTEGLRLQAAAEASQIIAYGTEAHNKKILEVLSGLQTASSEFKVVRLYDYDADSMIEVLNKLYGVSDTAEEVDPNAPVFMADPLYSDQLIIKAKPAQVEAIQKFVGSLDPEPSASQYAENNFIRIPKTGREADRVIQDIQDLIEVTKRPNKLDVRRSAASENGLKRMGRENPLAPNPSLPAVPKTEPMNTTPKTGSAAPNPAVTRDARFQRQSGLLNVYARAPLIVQDQETQEKQKKTDEPTQEDQSPANKSIPGAPVVIKETASGLLIISDDREMLAAIDAWLQETQGEPGPEMPRIVELKFRKAVEMKDLLEMFLGLSSDSSGGGGGGLGGMLGGLAQNAIGGAAGQMLGGLMGGGGGGGSTVTTSDMLTGDASIAADAQLNVLVVSANDTDFDLIMQYVDYFDVDGPENDPFLDGRTYSIPVQYRDAAELVELIKTMLPDRIKAPKQQGGGNPAAAQAQVLQQLMRGGRGGRNQGGGGSNGVEQTEPKMTVGADVAVNAVLVTGPEFLYKQVEEIVKTLDSPIAQGEEQMVVVPLKNMSSSAIKSLVDSMNATSGQEPSQNTSSNNRNRTGGAGAGATPTSTGNPQLDAMRAMGERMRALQQGGGRGGFQNANPFGGGGRGGRGGTTGGGGGRGGRGGR